MKKLLLLFTSLLLFACNGDKPSGNKPIAGDISKGIYEGKFVTKHRAGTTAGMRVETYNPPTAADFPLYDSGAKQTFEVAKEHYNYELSLTYNDKTVYAHPRSSYCENPGFAIPVTGLKLWPDGWDNHPEFDKDPRVGFSLLCAAGMQFGGNGALVAHDTSIAHNIVRFEFEHLILLHNDMERYVATMGVHNHPLLPGPEGIKEEEKMEAFSFQSSTTSLFGGSEDLVCVIGTR